MEPWIPLFLKLRRPLSAPHINWKVAVLLASEAGVFGLYRLET